MPAYNILGAPTDRLREIFRATFSTADAQRDAFERIGALVRVDPRHVFQYLTGQFSDLTADQEHGIKALVQHVAQRGTFPTAAEFGHPRPATETLEFRVHPDPEAGKVHRFPFTKVFR